MTITKDIFIIDKEILEANVDQNIYQEILPLNKSDKYLIINDLERRINSNPPDLNILKISNNLENNLVLYTTKGLINNQLNSIFYSNIDKTTKIIMLIILINLNFLMIQTRQI